MRQTSNKNLPGSTGSNKWIQKCRYVEILIFFFVNSEEGESRKRSVNIVLHC